MTIRGEQAVAGRCAHGVKDELALVGNLKPALALGNGELDQPMLEYADRAVVVAPYGDEGNSLVRAAIQKRWPIQRG